MRTAFAKPSDTEPARIAPLARLPIFFDLVEKPCLIAGATASVPWKAELLAAAGAQVTVLAADPDDDLLRLALTPRETGSIELTPRQWTSTDLAGAVLAVADLPDEAEARAFATAAREAGVPVNLVDRPHLCDFTFGSIVNRSPVVIGISTSGAAPILAQTIRQRIETLLPQALSSWASAVAQLRQHIAKAIPDRATRRAFWERFARRSLSGVAYEDGKLSVENPLDGTRSRTSSAKTGKVTLVGAGPGDPELLTVRAIRTLQSADVILFDALVSSDILEFARREAKRMLVGKRGHRASCRQDDINDLMARLARAGKHVVRLKGGDPSIFGRAGEEVDFLTARGIAVEIVPGITAASGAAARLGISLTHRDVAHSVRYVTGHGKDGGFFGDLDWTGIADPETSLILYMAGRTGAEVGRRLLDAGLSGSTPVSAVAAATRPEERVWIGDLAILARDGVPEYGGPVLIGIGRVFGKVAQSEAMPMRQTA